MQLLAYHIAVLRDYDVDMPRNLAKERHGGVYAQNAALPRRKPRTL
jgi:hypothetical protein